MKPDPARLNLDAYPFTVEVPTRFADVDPLRHLNNVRLAEIYEEGRVRLHLAMAVEGAREKGSRTVIAQLTVRYLAEGFYPATLLAGGGVSRIGGSSYEIAQGLFQDGRCIGTCDTVLVYTREGRSAPLPETLRTQLRPYQLRA
ncbi:MAG: thioesterase family protein [Proteobacteria bacterium]|nr:thioesterase family protein [Pseudomonadota bacterium]MBW3618469.1 thioesterase family protein [Pseudomonadota bacterium]